jgi:carbamoyl-phosphate synthase large subunit
VARFGNRALIAGIAGASLGTELAKCLRASGVEYAIFGCDVSQFAYGLYDAAFDATFLIDRNRYIDELVALCEKLEIDWLLPGGEEPLLLLNQYREMLSERSIRLVANTDRVIRQFTNKADTFACLSKLGFEIPQTVLYKQRSDIASMPTPCIVKPSIGSGGSSSVIIAANRDDAAAYAGYLLDQGQAPIVQEYLSLNDGGEYSVGVLSLPGHGVVDSIAMQRTFSSKLSIHDKTSLGLISSPYGQGLIDNFTTVLNKAEEIARAVDSEGPLNIQGRIKNGSFVPFEINPRFSGSEFIRCMAGLNQPHTMIQYLRDGFVPRRADKEYGYYFRSLCETFVPREQLKS